MFRGAATGQFDSPAHPNFTANIVSKSDNITTQRVEPSSIFIHGFNHPITSLGNLTSTFRLYFQKLVMFMKPFFEAS